ncbi:DUF636 domain protein [Xylariales sp. PMI_506]|nr:DUF636 domain protein [Xylariales sp. PMI_506]
MTAADSADSKTVTAKCYCESAHFTLTLPKDILPLGVHLCHCSICRWTHGTLCVFHANPPTGIAPKFIAPSGLDKLTGYEFPGSENIRYFCSTCGCHIGDVCPRDGGWAISVSLFPQDASVFQIRTHACPDSALGGGLHDWLPKVGSHELKIWNPDGDAAAPVRSEPEVGPNGEERLRAQCHCGGVSFTFPRPSEAVRSDPALNKFVSPVDKTKWVGCLDACDDCRLTNSSHVAAWAFIPLTLFEPKIELDLLIGTSKTFQSSPGVLRSFCGTCGATVFYWCDDRKNVVDLAVGILRAPEGVRAENWLTWRAGRLGWEDSGLRYDREFTKSLRDGLHQWGMEKYGRSLDFDIG